MVGPARPRQRFELFLPLENLEAPPPRTWQSAEPAHPGAQNLPARDGNIYPVGWCRRPPKPLMSTDFLEKRMAING
jgi:hypothetical protein